jgi:FtsP/CotA-like multicopper oxidase with cupredoxin domain
MHFIEEANGPRSEVFESFLYRNRVWVHSQIDPALNAVVAGGTIPDPATVRDNFLPHYFSLNGRAGATTSHSPDVVPIGTVGEPHLIRLLNAGLTVHSPHLHANHFYITSVNNVVGGATHQGPAGDGLLPGDILAPDNVVLLDTMTLGPQERVDWVIPFMRPPDIPRVLEDNTIFRPGDVSYERLLSLTELTQEERHMVFITAQTPLSWPMHCHIEQAQSAAGGNYPQGQVTQWEIHGEFGRTFESDPIKIG